MQGIYPKYGISLIFHHLSDYWAKNEKFAVSDFFILFKMWYGQAAFKIVLVSKLSQIYIIIAANHRRFK